jgi:hypothetical protein
MIDPVNEATARLEMAAEALGETLPQLIFVGGSVMHLLVTDTASRQPRPTVDLDCIVEVTTRAAFYKIENNLRKAGFRNDESNPPVICRWKLNDLILDVMPSDPAVLGFSNRWYSEAIQMADSQILPSGRMVKIISPVHFFATKTEAFRNRGYPDFRGSHDFEDILFLINGREEIVQEINRAGEYLRNAMKAFWMPHIETPDFAAAVNERLDAYEEIERSHIVLKRFTQMFFTPHS